MKGITSNNCQRKVDKEKTFEKNLNKWIQDKIVLNIEWLEIKTMGNQPRYERQSIRF